jgi:hypothetical protein
MREMSSPCARYGYLTMQEPQFYLAECERRRRCASLRQLPTLPVGEELVAFGDK